MSFTLYSRSFPPKYGGCCHTDCTNNDIAPQVTTVYINGYEYGIKPVIRDIKGCRILALDTFIHQPSGTLILKLPSPPLYPRKFYVETCQDVQPYIKVDGCEALVQCVNPIQPNYYLWCVTW